jgi:hypothetical protein
LVAVGSPSITQRLLQLVKMLEDLLLVRPGSFVQWSEEGGLTAERQQFREELRIETAERFARGETSSVIAKALRVSVRSVQRWRRHCRG